MNGVVLGLIIVILFIIIIYSPFGRSTSYAIMGALALVAWGLLIENDKIEPPTELKTSQATTKGAGVSVKRLLKDALRNAKQALIAGSAGVAALGSFGTGGDTIVEVLALMLDCGMYLGELAVIFLQDTSSVSGSLQRIWNVHFRDGVNGVKDQMQKIYLAAGPDAKEIFSKLRELYSGFIEWLITLFGRGISALIPDDSNMVAWFFGETMIAAVRNFATNVYWIMNSIYNRVVGDFVHAILQQPEELKKLIINIIGFVKQYILTNDTDSWAAWVAKHVGRQTLVATTGMVTLLAGSLIAAPIAIPAAVFIVLGGSILNVMSSTGLGRDQMTAVLDALYEKEFTVVGLGKMTAVDALVQFFNKVVPLTFAGMFVLSDYETIMNEKTHIMPVDQLPGQIDSREIAPKVETNVIVKDPGAKLDEVGDLPKSYAKSFKEQDVDSLDDLLENTVRSVKK